MGNSNTVNVVTLLIVISKYGLVWGQHLSCPAQDWTLDSTITLRCYLPTEVVPSKCTGSFNDRVTFKRRLSTGSGSDRCTVNDVSTTSCTPSSNECGCQPANATYFMVHHTFTVDADDDGTWQCSVPCLNDGFLPVLTFTSDYCGTREVVAYAVLSTPTIAVTTPDTGSGWTVRGTVDITRIFSSTGDYSCMWSYRRDSGQYRDITSSTITTHPPVSGTSVRTGQCDFPDRPLSSDPGTYTYRVTVSPGQTVKTDSSVVIETPFISSSNCNPSTGYVVENGEVTCTCNGNVGQPAGRLRWFMESTTGTTAIEDGQYGDGTLTVRQTVNRNHHGNKLRCEVDWITDITGPDFTLQVAYPPSSPVISWTDGQSYPPLEGESVTLNCSLTSPGYPSAGITWPSEGPAVNTNPLQLSVGRGDNQRDVTCQASNEFTQQKGLELRDYFTLQVYYGPYITLSPADGNECIMTSDRTSCSVVEGERLHLQCDVDSNPDPNDCIWSVSSGSDIDLDSGPDLDIVSVNRTHSGVYQVQAETTKPGNSDGRLPLRAHRNLTVLVKSRRDDGGGGIDAAAIGAGIAAAVLVIVVVPVVIFLVRRKRRKPSKAQRRGHNARQDEPEMIVNDLYGRSPGTADDDQETMIVNDFYESSGNVAPRVAASGGASGGAYEEVGLDKGTNGVTKVQQQPGPSGAGADNVYAEVKKPKNSKKSIPPVASPADETANVCAVVVKKQGKLDISPRTAEPGPSARPKPAPKLKTKKGKQNKTAGQTDQEAEGAEYGNTAPLPGVANQAEGSVYGDNGFKKDERDPAGADAVHARSEVPQAAQDDDGSRTVNADGLAYTTVAFTESQRQKEKEPAPEREFTEYAGLDFTKMAA